MDCSFKSNISLYYMRNMLVCYRGVNTVHIIVSSRVSTEDRGPGRRLVRVPV